MQRSASPTRAQRISAAGSIFLLLLAMMLPVCHLHPLADKSGPDHCAICVSLHAAAPMAIAAPPVVQLAEAGRVALVLIDSQSAPAPRLAASRAPPCAC